jgi:ubiquinone/menaquinone biosynthesis C-methylase UbiE
VRPGRDEEGAGESFAGVANPFVLGTLSAGEHVLDLGSGAGTDSLVAARMVGAEASVTARRSATRRQRPARRRDAPLAVDRRGRCDRLQRPTISADARRTRARYRDDVTRVRHPVFARCFARCAPRMEQLGVAQHRGELLAGISGKVIEIGAGTGANFPHYPDSVREIVAVEPEPYLRARAATAAARSIALVVVVDAVADELPFENASFDVAVTSLVLCSVADQPAALAELHRVVRPGGELRFYEHVRAELRRLASAQRALDIVWPQLGGGCHASRDTLQAIADAGFAIEHVRRFTFRPCLLAAPTSPHILGAARRHQ